MSSCLSSQGACTRAKASQKLKGNFDPSLVNVMLQSSKNSPALAGESYFWSSLVLQPTSCHSTAPAIHFLLQGIVSRARRRWHGPHVCPLGFLSSCHLGGYIPPCGKGKAGRRRVLLSSSSAGLGEIQLWMSNLAKHQSVPLQEGWVSSWQGWDAVRRSRAHGVRPHPLPICPALCGGDGWQLFRSQLMSCLQSGSKAEKCWEPQETQLAIAALQAPRQSLI